MSDDAVSLEVPKWDPALAALVREEFANRKRPLQLQDFLELAQQHAIRFDDIMVTMFELCIHGEWFYTNRSGAKTAITREMFDKLYMNGRLQESDLRDYSGSWALVKP